MIANIYIENTVCKLQLAKITGGEKREVEKKEENMDAIF